MSAWAVPLVFAAALWCPQPLGPANGIDAFAPVTATPSIFVPGDAWLAEDKLRHFALSFGVTAFSYAAARTALDPDPALRAAGVAALAAGVGKELYDVRQGQHFSVKDLVWDIAGVALGLVLVHNTR